METFYIDFHSSKLPQPLIQFYISHDVEEHQWEIRVLTTTWINEKWKREWVKLLATKNRHYPKKRETVFQIKLNFNSLTRENELTHYESFVIIPSLSIIRAVQNDSLSL